MEIFTGSLDALKSLVQSCNAVGEWTEIASAHQFRSQDGAILNWYPSRGRVVYQGNPDRSEALRAALSAASSPGAMQRTSDEQLPSARPRVFVVHGHDNQSREQLELILHKLGLDPFVLSNTGGDGLTIIEALEREIVREDSRARFGIVLLTPDDEGYSKRDGPEASEPRARQNVVLEMGMLLAALGRSNVAILRRGHLVVPSDAQGIIYLPFNDHVRETVPRLVDRLRTAGFNLDSEAITRAAS